MSELDVIGFGALNIDRLFKVNEISRADEENIVLDFKESCGGSAANTIVALARLGYNVGFIGKIACDKTGSILVEDFIKEGVNVDNLIRVKNGFSGNVMGFVNNKGERALYVSPGVNDTIQLNEIDRNYLSKTRFFHMSSFVNEKVLKIQEKIIEILPESVKVTFDPGMLYSKLGMKKLKNILNRTFALILNLKEIKLLTGVEDYKKGIKTLHEQGAKIVAVKMDRKGCYVDNGEVNYLIKSFNVNVVDTTGAGDAFCAGFIYGLISGKNLYESGKLGNFVASCCIKKMGARCGLPYLKELRFLN